MPAPVLSCSCPHPHPPPLFPIDLLHQLPALLWCVACELVCPADLGVPPVGWEPHVVIELCFATDAPQVPDVREALLNIFF